MFMDSQSIGQVGEYLVASHLCRMGFIATTFTRNMPDFDILALTKNRDKHLKIQIKTVLNGDWQLSATSLLNIKFNDNNNQIVQEILGFNESNNADFYIFIRLDKRSKNMENINLNEISDSFYIVPTNDLKSIVNKNYGNYLHKKNGVRPSNQKSTHTKVDDKKDLVLFKDRWDLLLQ